MGRPSLAWLRATLTPARVPWGWFAAARAFVAIGIVAGVGLLLGGSAGASLAYFGAVVGAAFIIGGVYRARLFGVLASAIGATAGIAIGSLVPHDLVWLVVTATLAGFVSGAIGAIGTASAIGGLMFLVGIAVGQFTDFGLPWWQEALWYFAGAALPLAAAVLPWLFRGDRVERGLIADVYDRCAALLDATGAEGRRAAKADLVAATSAVRGGVFQYRLRPRRRREGAPTTIDALAAAAWRAAVQTVALYVPDEPVPDGVQASLREAGANVRAGRAGIPAIRFDAEDPRLHGITAALRLLGADDGVASMRGVRPLGERFRAGLRAALGRSGVIAGLRLAICAGIAAAVTALLPSTATSFWLPMTVAVIVRPEFGTLAGRTVNRIAGTLVGALLAVPLLLLIPAGWALMLLATLAYTFAILALPKLYAFAVVGITVSALAASAISDPDPSLPWLRLLDTVIAAGIAVVFGYLLWPGSWRVPGTAKLGDAAEAIRRYLGLIRDGAEARRLAFAREDAAQAGHRAHDAIAAAMAEPPPTGERAERLLPAAIELENVVDELVALEAAQDVRAGPPDAERLAALEERIDRVATAAGGAEGAEGAGRATGEIERRSD